VGLRVKTEEEYEQAFRNIRKVTCIHKWIYHALLFNSIQKRSQLNPVRHHTYIHQATRKLRSLEQMKSEQHQEMLREKAAATNIDGTSDISCFLANTSLRCN